MSTQRSIIGTFPLGLHISMQSQFNSYLLYAGGTLGQWVFVINLNFVPHEVPTFHYWNVLV